MKTKSNHGAIKKMEYLLIAVNLFAIFGGFVKFYRDGWKNRYQIYLDFSKAIDKEKPNKLLVERLFFHMTKCHNVSYHEIYHLMKSSTPTKTISDFMRVRKNGTFFTIDKNGTAIYVEKYNTFKKRLSNGCKHFIVFLLFYSLVIITPIFASKGINEWLSENIVIDKYNQATNLTVVIILIITLTLGLVCIKIASSTLAIFNSNKFIVDFNINTSPILSKYRENYK